MATSISFETLLDLLPVGSIRELAKLNPEEILKDRLRILDKDRQRMQAFIPAAIKRAMELGVGAGIHLAAAKEDGAIPQVVVDISDEAKAFAKETDALFEAFLDQAKALASGHLSADPYKDEREWLRIYCKRNGIDAAYAEAVGVSDNTPTEYPQEYVDKYLS